VFLKNKKFSKSIFSGIITFSFSLILANIFQFLLFVNLPENIKTDLTILFTFIFAVLLNYFIHIKYIFLMKFKIAKLINFYIANLLNLFVPILFWFIYEYFLGSPTIKIFNFYALLITFSLFPIKFLFYNFIFKN